MYTAKVYDRAVRQRCTTELSDKGARQGCAVAAWVEPYAI